MNAKHSYEQALLKVSLTPEIDEGDFKNASIVVAQIVSKAMQASRVSVWSLTENNKKLELVCLIEKEELSEQEMSLLKKDFPIYFNTLLTERSINASHAQEHPATNAFTESYLKPLNIFSLLDAPVRMHGLPNGVLCIEQCEAPRIWTDEDVQFTTAVSEILARAKASEYRKKIEHQLFDTNRRLEELVEERSSKLLKAQRQLIRTEKLASLGELVAGVAHEINTPIGIGVTATSFLQDRVLEVQKKFQQGTLTQSQFQDFLNSLQESSQLLSSNLDRAAQLIKSFKQIASDQTMENESYRFNLKTTVEDTLASLSPKLKKTNIQISAKCPKKIQFIGNPGKFSQILTNLILNSITHGFEEGGTGSISLEFIERKTELQLFYQDSGKGIPQEKWDKVFEPFYTTRRGKGGTGLGMFIIHNLIVEDLGGSLELLSGDPKGFRLKATFPLPQEVSSIKE